MNTYFTPGPSHPYPKLRQYLDDAWNADVVSWSHRSSAFSDTYRRAENALRTLLDIPAGYRVLFVGSATEAMERAVQGLAAKYTHHYVLGAFGAKWHEISGQLGKTATHTSANPGMGMRIDTLEPHPDAELLCVTLNETSAGTLTPKKHIAKLGQHKKRALLALDIVSAAPLVPVDWGTVDVAFFSVQKAFGLPAGLGVLIISEHALAHAEALQKTDLVTGSYHSLVQLAKAAEKAQTPETPNVLGIYLLARVAEDMAEIGAATLQAQTKKRAELLYTLLDTHTHLRPFVEETAWRSPTVIVADVISADNQPLLAHLQDHKLIPGKGYAPEHKGRHLRIANFPAISDVAFDTLLMHLNEWKPRP